MINLKAVGDIFVLKTKRLSDHSSFKNGLPDGILNKKYTGIGATYTELNSDRNSILVFPYRSIAWEKHQKYGAFYVGTKPNSDVVSARDVKDYLLKSSTPKKGIKFVVVAESLKKLITGIKDAGQNPFKDYFLVLDEVEILQFHSKFRSQLPRCLDYFLKFDEKCMVSATMIPFSNKEILDIPTHLVEMQDPRMPEINLIRTKKEPHITLANRLGGLIKSGEYPYDRKCLIGLNSIKGIKQIIDIFEKSGVYDLSVSCSESSRRNFKKEYFSKRIQDGKLQAKINIATSAYWSGIDINEKYMPYAVCLDSELHHFFSFETLIQFEGRCRVPDNFNLKLIIPQKIRTTNFELENVAAKDRENDLQNLLQYIDDEIRSDGDKKLIKKALCKTEGGILYESIEENIPKVNHLLIDLENYRERLVEKLKDNGKEYIEDIQGYFKLLSDGLDSDSNAILPEKSEKLYEKDYSNFLSHFNLNVDPQFLIDNILNNPINRNQVAAYWYFFGIKFFQDHEMSLNFSKFMSADPKFCVNFSNGMAELVSFYIYYKEEYEKLLKDIFINKNNKGNVDAAAFKSALDLHQNHFNFIYSKPNTTRSRIINKVFSKFLGWEPVNPNANNLKFKVLETNPFQENKDFSEKVKYLRTQPTNKDAISFFNSNITSLLLHKIQ